MGTYLLGILAVLAIGTIILRRVSFVNRDEVAPAVLLTMMIALLWPLSLPITVIFLLMKWAVSSRGEND